MNKLIKVQFIRLFNNMLFYIVAIFLIIIGFVNGYVKYAPHGVCGYECYIISLTDSSFIFLVSVVVYLFVRMEFADRTIHNEIKLGFNRSVMVVARTIVITVSTSIVYMIYPVSNAVGTGIVNGFHAKADFISIIVWSFIIVLQLISILSINFFIVFIFQANITGVAVSVCVSVIVCNIIRNFDYHGTIKIIMENISSYRMQQRMDTLSGMDLVHSIICALVLTIIFMSLGAIVYRHSDVK